MTQVADGTLRHLKGVAEGEHTPGDVKNAAAVKVKTAQAKVAALADPAASYDKAYANFTTLLDALDKALDAVNMELYYMGGEEYQKWARAQFLEEKKTVERLGQKQ